MLARFSTLALVALAACSSSSTTTPTPPPAATSETPGDGTEQDATTPTTAAYTAAEVQDLFDTKCVRCHASNNALLDLSSFEKSTIGVATAGGRAECATSKYRVRIVPGDREASLLWHKVKGTHDCGEKMPPSGSRLTADETERLGLYIDALAK